MTLNKKPQGKYQKKMYSFLKRNEGWHSIATDSLTQRNAKSLRRKGLIEINKFNQMRLKK